MSCGIPDHHPLVLPGGYDGAASLSVGRDRAFEGLRAVRAGDIRVETFLPTVPERVFVLSGPDVPLHDQTARIAREQGGGCRAERRPI